MTYPGAATFPGTTTFPGIGDTTQPLGPVVVIVSAAAGTMSISVGVVAVTPASVTVGVSAGSVVLTTGTATLPSFTSTVTVTPGSVTLTGGVSGIVGDVHPVQYSSVGEAHSRLPYGAVGSVRIHDSSTGTVQPRSSRSVIGSVG